MARRRARMGRRASFRGSSGGFRRRAKSAVSGTAPLLAAGLYGAGRQYLATWIQPVTSKIPMGNIADEVGMLAANWAIKKYAPMPILKQAASAGMLIEAAAIGQAIASGQVNMGASTSGSSGFMATLG